jgi:hypothetical protein
VRRLICGEALLFRQVYQLPFILRLGENQVFPLKYNDISVTIRFKTPPRTEQKPITYTLLIIDSTKNLDDDSGWAFEAYSRVNEIIKAYQIVTDDIFNNGVISPLTWNQFACNSMIAEFDEKGNLKTEPKVLYIFLGKGEELIEEMKYKEVRSLAESPALMSERVLDEILIQAKIFLEQHNFRMAILESVIALEFALSSIVRTYAIGKGLSQEKTDSLIFKLGVAGSLDSLKLFFEGELSSSEIVSACRKANSLRNDIVHRAYMKVIIEEAREALAAVESFTRHFNLKLS